MKMINSYELNKGIKKGWGVDDFVRAFSLEDANELIERLNSLFNYNTTMTQKFIRKMNNNDKSKKGTASKKPSPKAAQCKDSSDNAESNDLAVIEDTNTSDLENKEARKARCEEQLKSFEDKLIILEKERKELKKENQNISQKIGEQREVIEKWLIELEKQQETLTQNIELLEKNKAKLNENTEGMTETRNSIQELKAELETLSETVVYIGTNANAEADYKLSDESFSPEEINAKVSMLLLDDEGDMLNEFTVVQMKFLAKVVLLLEKVQEKVNKENVVIYAEEDGIITTWLQLMEWTVK